MSRFSKLEFEYVSPGRLETAAESTVPDEGFHLREAAAAFENGDFEEALRAYAKVLEHNPRNPVPWTGQVRMLIELGEFREAKLWADKALEMFPHEPELLAAKAVALARLGDFKAAMAYSDASFGERGDSAYLWVARADVLLAQRQPKADYCIERAIILDPANWLVHWLISRVNSYYGRFAHALASAQKALALDVSRAQVWLQTALCQQELGLLDAAFESNTHALRLNPTDPRAREMMASLEMTPAYSSWWRRCRQFFRK
ncbi:tetratricopeptide repeat protein [Luteolibacter yonseiensis]|uniref:Tetratricopeptide repeat protein n=1 Tax=Luteolibacter yonseiensis TaxID=1144680 RepID=A0A934R1Z2_9BACT|nr:tetratricopeptide repeat protein [Luteolibacter yonseiensis]MBK1814967.1 tetratricopeptide repeat protein [Luteolibacter yonseiensis]